MGEKVAKRRTFDPEWIRFPADPEGRAAGPVITYKLSPEELAELDKLPKPAGKAPIVLQLGKKRKEAEEMQDIEPMEEADGMPVIQMTEAEAEENLQGLPSDNAGQTTQQEQQDFYETGGGRRFTAERIARAEKSLSREEYVRLKNEGVTDLKIKKTKGFSGDLMVALKKKWGLEDLNLRKARPRKASAKPPEEPKTDTVLPAHTEESKEALRTRAVAVGLTITQALQLRVELTEDIDSLNRILDVAQRGAELTDRVVQMLTWYRDSYRQHLERIEEVFSRTVVQL